MRESRPHGFAAWLFDLYIASYFVGGAVALLLALLGERGSGAWALLYLAVVLLGTTIYHRAISRRVTLLSPGERVAGRYYDAGRGEKVWRNPYKVSRFPLFVFMLMIAALAGNTWDSIPRGESLVASVVLVRMAVLAILAASLVLVGRGKVWGMAGIAFYAAMLAAGAYLQPLPFEVSSVVRNLVAGYLLACVLVATGFWIFYSKAVDA